MRLPTFAFSLFFFLLFLLSTLFPFLPSPLPLSPSLSLRPFKEKRNCILYAYVNRASLPTRVSDLFFKWKKTKGNEDEFDCSQGISTVKLRVCRMYPSNNAFIRSTGASISNTPTIISSVVTRGRDMSRIAPMIALLRVRGSVISRRANHPAA